ncbi:MAG: hypothetical protein LBR07_02150 [Puniceicoccales bacterium]|jgi:hypothetical protein|nr:hypothetical protein [Puniceicoccales bacterium]
MDDLGNPVPNQEVGMVTFHHHVPGPELGKNIYKEFNGITGKDGSVTLHGEGVNPKFLCAMSYRNDFYLSYGETFTFKKVKLGRWEPWNPTVAVVVRPILNPIPMYHKWVETKIPRVNEQFGFDLSIGDWVAPAGNGKTADILFKMLEILPMTQKKDKWGHMRSSYDFRFEVTFPNKGDGIQQFIERDIASTETLTMPRFAPTEKYSEKLELREYIDEKGYRRDMMREDMNYFIRVRTVLDKDGKVKSALYGKIPGGIEFRPYGDVRFRYYLNPTPNDTNMEYDQKRNLIPPDKPANRAKTRPKKTNS